MLSNAFVAICMLLPTMPSALMLLDLGSLSNLMMTNAAVFLTCSLPKKTQQFFGGRKKTYLSAPPPNAFFFFFFTYLAKTLEEESGRGVILGQGWP